MRLLTYLVDKGGSYQQSTVPRDGYKAWKKIQTFYEEYACELETNDIQVSSPYEVGESEFVDSFLNELPIISPENNEKGARKFRLANEKLEECVERLTSVKDWPDLSLLEIGINPIQIEISTCFSWRSFKSSAVKFQYPDWYEDYNSKSQVLLWIGPKSKISPYLILPYDFGTDEHRRCIPNILESMPIKCSIKNFRIYEKAKTKNTYRAFKPNAEEKLYIGSLL